MRSFVFLISSLLLAFTAEAQSPSDTAYDRCNRARGPLEYIVATCTDSLKEDRLTTRSRARIHTIIGNKYKDFGLYQQAIIEYESSILIDPNYQYGYNGRAISRAFLGDIDKALEDFDKAIELTPNDSIILNNRAQWHAETKSFEKALSDYAKAANISPMDPSIYYNRAITYTSMRRIDDAIADYNKAIQIKPNYHQAYLNRSLLRKKPEEKLADINAALLAWPDFTLALIHRGNIHNEMRNFDLAIVDFTRVIDNSPQFPGALSGRGFALLAKGEIDKAFRDFNEAIRLAPTADAFKGRSIIWDMRGEFQRGIEDLFEYDRLEDARRLSRANRPRFTK